VSELKYISSTNQNKEAIWTTRIPIRTWNQNKVAPAFPQFICFMYNKGFVFVLGVIILIYFAVSKKKVEYYIDVFHACAK
jgi:hypothetical protein